MPYEAPYHVLASVGVMRELGMQAESLPERQKAEGQGAKVTFSEQSVAVHNRGVCYKQKHIRGAVACTQSIHLSN